MFDPRLIDMVMRLRARGISDADTLRAIEQTPRKAFLPLAFSEDAYEDRALPLSCGQVATAPMNVAIMVQCLKAGTAHKLLAVGLGSGWQAAVLSRMVRRVYTVERYKTLIDEIEGPLKRLGIHTVETRHGDGRFGWPGQAPFDRIILSCAVRAVPDKLLDQLAPFGRLVAVVDGQLTVVEKARKHIKEETIIPLELPMIEAGKSRTL